MSDNQDESAGILAGSMIIPGIVWEEYKWEGTIALPEWEAFNNGRGAWRVIRKATNIRRRKREKRAGQNRFLYADSDEPIGLSISSPDSDARLPPSSEQVRAYKLLLAHEAKLLANVLTMFMEHWSSITCVYDHPDEDPNRHSMPLQLRAPEEMCGLIELHHVYIKRQHTDGVAHVGLALSCDWDTEHGFGVYSCNGEVLGLGSGDLAFGRLSSAFKFSKTKVA